MTTDITPEAVQAVRERLDGTDDTCPFCGHDPYHYVDIGVGMDRAAVNCCDLGIALFRDGDEQLAREVELRHKASALIGTLFAALGEARADRTTQKEAKEGWQRQAFAQDKAKLAAKARADAATAELEKVREAVSGIEDDYMTSDVHHPGHVLIPVAKFEQIRAALASRTDGGGK